MGKFFKKFRSRLNLAVLGSVTVLFIFTMTSLPYFVPPDTRITARVLFIVICISYAVCIVLYAVLAARKEIVIKETVPVLPKVRSICPTRINSAEIFRFILESNSIYEIGSYVTIHYEDNNEFMTQLGEGYVESINDKRSTQVIMTHKSTDPEAARIINSLGNHCVNAIRVKPYIQNYYRQEDLFNERNDYWQSN